MTAQLPSEYLTDQVLYLSTWFLPHLMMHLPGQLKFDYTNRFELALAELVMQQLKGEVISQTVGFDSRYDVLVRMNDGCEMKVEIKCSKNHNIRIEVGRHDFSISGISATDAHLYLMITKDTTFNEVGQIVSNKGKVRISTVATLVKMYDHKNEIVYLPNQHGPGSRCYKVDSTDSRMRHAWIGDIPCAVDRHGNAMYDTSCWQRLPADRNTCIGMLDREISAMFKTDPRLKEFA